MTTQVKNVIKSVVSVLAVFLKLLTLTRTVSTLAKNGVDVKQKVEVDA